MVIYLTGFMGSGKTTLGRRLARLAGVRFVDVDTETERNEGRSIASIFSEEGEDYFRRAEYSALRNIDLADGAVVATGGGAPCFSDNMDYMNSSGVTVYLKMSPEALASRLSKATTARPLIAGLRGESLLNYIEEKISEREPFYLRSRIVYDGLNASAPALLRIIRSLSDRSVV